MRKKSANTTVKCRQAHGESRIMKFILGIYVTQTHLACVVGANRGAGRGGGGGGRAKGKKKGKYKIRST